MPSLKAFNTNVTYVKTCLALQNHKTKNKT